MTSRSDGGSAVGRAGAAGPASARARPAVPIHSSGPARACPARTMASRSSSAVASHRKKPRPAIRSADGAGRIGRPRRCSSARRSTSTGCHAVVSGRPPVLAAAPRDPLLRREGGRDHRAREVAAREARRDLVDGAAAQQRVDLLVGEVGAAQRCEPARSRDLEVARFAVQREAAARLRRRALVPEHRQRTGHADQRRRGVERAGQVIGDDPDEGHAAARSGIRTQPLRPPAPEGTDLEEQMSLFHYRHGNRRVVGSARERSEHL